MYYIYTKHLDPHHWEWYWTQWTHWNIWYSRSNESPFQEEYDRGCGGVVSLPNTLALEWGAGNLSSGGGSFFTCTHFASLDLGQGQMPDDLMTSQTQGRRPEKMMLFFWILSKSGGGRALPNFFDTFSQVHFWSITGVYFLQNANDLNFELFFGCVHDPQSKYSAFI